MPGPKKFKGPLVSPLAIKFDAINTHQGSCPFLNLTPEIRNVIYEMVLAPGQPLTIYPFMPFHISRKLSLSLLSTCRQIYLETHLHPLQTNMHLDVLLPCRTKRTDSRALHGRYPFLRMPDWQKSTIEEVTIIVNLCHFCFRRGPNLRVFLARTGMAPHLRTLHLHFVAEIYHRLNCHRKRYWARHMTRRIVWDLKNFALLKEITIEYEQGMVSNTVTLQQLDLQRVVSLARTWSFQVGGNRVLKLDLNKQQCTNLVVANSKSSVALRWI